MNEDENVSFKTKDWLMADSLVRQAFVAGIPREHLAISKQRLRAKLDEPWMQQHVPKWESWLDDIYDIHSSWAKTRLIVLVDGASIVDRAFIGHALLYRSIVNNASAAQSSALSKRSDELVTVFSQFGDARAILLDNLRRIQCLLISEVSEFVPRSVAYGNLYFNELLQARQEANRPTILTFANPNIQDRNYGEFSRLLDEVIRQPDSGLRKVYRFRLTS